MNNKARFFLVSIIILTSVFTGCSKDEESEKVKDADGNEYRIVTIRNQVWMAENLRTTKYNDGNTISNHGNDDVAWMTTTSGAYCWYANSDVNKPVYGALYNGYAVSTGKLCPVGWRVPTLDDWIVLMSFLGGTDVAGGKLKEKGIAHWISTNTCVTDDYGFTALPGGRRSNIADFRLKGKQGWWWTSTDNVGNPEYSSHIYMADDDCGVYYYSVPKTYGLSVRCIKN